MHPLRFAVAVVIIAGASIVLFMLPFDGNPTRVRSDQVFVAVVRPSITPTSMPATDPTQELVGDAELDPVVLKRTTPEPRLASLSGSAWLSRNDGSSDLLRGLPVCVFPAKVPATSVCKQFQGTLESWARYTSPLTQECSAKKARYEVADAQYKVLRDVVHAEYVQYRECRERISFAAIATEELGKFLNSLAGEPGVTDVHKDFKDALKYIIHADLSIPAERTQFLDAMSPLAVQRTTTGAEGKYSFDSLSPGEYVLYAVLDTKALCAEWLLLIHVSPGGAVLADLSNQNTITLSNKQP